MNADEEIRRLQEDIYINNVKEDIYSGITPLEGMRRGLSNISNEEYMNPCEKVTSKINTSYDEKQ